MTNAPQEDLPASGVTARKLLEELQQRLRDIGEESNLAVWHERARMSALFNPKNEDATMNPVTSLEAWIRGVADDQTGSFPDRFMAMIDVATEDEDPPPIDAHWSDNEDTTLARMFEAVKDTLDDRSRRIQNAGQANYDVTVLPEDSVLAIRKAIAELTKDSLAPYGDAPEK